MSSQRYTLLFYRIEPLKNGPSLILPSSIARNSSAPNAKRIFQILRGILEGCINSARCHFLTLSKKCLRLCPNPSKCLSKRINWIISRIPHRISKILFALGADEFLAVQESKIREAPFFKGSIW